MSPRVPTERGMAKRRLGISGEDLASRWYASEGYEVIERNWRCREGEIDLIVRDGNVVAFCEVKTRSSNRFGSPLEAVTPTKQRRLRLLATKWLTEHKLSGMSTIRFDVVSITGNDIEVVVNAF